ncbi:phosphohydrolase [Paraburkholderia sediminicola]|uniref:phosphohydrolase n=1 Tax=Paraburkholderia sediminicola TaxID=458836 RepID=UPI0038B7C983
MVVQTDSSQPGPPSRRIGGVDIPTGDLACDALATAELFLPDLLNHHAHRVFIFAVLAGRHRALIFDQELLYAAAMFMNVGLTDVYARSQRRYELDSASALRQCLTSRKVVDGSVLEAWYAVALHTTHEIPDHASPLAASLASGVRMDLFGDKAAIVAREAKTEILNEFPRGKRFKERFIEAIGKGVAHRPASTFGGVSADVLERVDPNYCRLNYCGLILGAKWKD